MVNCQLWTISLCAWRYYFPEQGGQGVKRIDCPGHIKTLARHCPVVMFNSGVCTAKIAKYSQGSNNQVVEKGSSRRRSTAHCSCFLPTLPSCKESRFGVMSLPRSAIGNGFYKSNRLAHLGCSCILHCIWPLILVIANIIPLRLLARERHSIYRRKLEAYREIIDIEERYHSFGDWLGCRTNRTLSGEADP